MLIYKKGNLLESGCNIIVHQVNCQRIMGSGIAKQIRAKWPIVYKSYDKFIGDSYYTGVIGSSKDLLGKIHPVPIATLSNDVKFVVNFFSQNNYIPRGICHTDYNAFRSCCIKLKNFLIDFNIPSCRIGFPYKIGCGLAGGDWSIVSKIIEEELSDYNVEIWEYQS